MLGVSVLIVLINPSLFNLLIWHWQEYDILQSWKTFVPGGIGGSRWNLEGMWYIPKVASDPGRCHLPRTEAGDVA